MSNSKRDSGLRFLLKEARKKKGFTQAQLAEMVEMSAGAICDLEKGKAALPNDYNIVKLCHALEVNPGDIIVLTKPMPVNKN